MYVVCDSMWNLSDSCYYRSSFSEALHHFLSRYPGTTSLLVFRDVRSSGKLGDLQFVCLMNRKMIDKFLSRL